MKDPTNPSDNPWKRPWRGARGVLLWLLLLVVASLLIVYLIGSLSERNRTGMTGTALIIGVLIPALALLLYFFTRWLCHWRNLRRFLFVVACLATLIALFYAEENWRGKHAWETYKQAQEAKDEYFNLASLAPPPVPDNQNFAMAPIVAGSYAWLLDRTGHRRERPDTNIIDRLKMPIKASVRGLKAPAAGGWQKAERTDLQAWQQYYRKAAQTNLFPIPPEPRIPAADVLLALSKYDAAIGKLRQAARRPYSRFPFEYNEDDPFTRLFPHLAPLRSCARALQLRAVAEVDAGEMDAASADVKLMFRLVDSIRTEPDLISQLVRIAMLNMTLQPVWEGMADHQWSDKQLAAFDQELGKLDFLADYRLAMRGEMACVAGWADYAWRTRELGITSSRISRLIPSGWFYQNALRCIRFENAHYLPLADVVHQLVSPAACLRADKALAVETKHVTPYNFLEKMMLPALSRAVERFASAQSHADLARVACALERSRLAHGQYPGSLDALAPEFLKEIPHDIIGGKPLHYRRTPDGGFMLYSVGWNETDDGGKVALRKDGKINLNEGDWVWRIPGK